MTHEANTAINSLSTPDALMFLLYGFGVVMFTLALLWALTSLIGWILKKLGLDKMPAPAPAKRKSAAIPPEVIAVITAAVSFATGGQGSIREIKRKN